MNNIEDSQNKLGEKLDLGNKGTMTGLKIQLQETYEKQYCRISSKSSKWSSDLDQVFREAYKAYKDLGGNGIVDRIKVDMDIWRDKYAGDSFIDNEKVYRLLKRDTIILSRAHFMWSCADNSRGNQP